MQPDLVVLPASYIKEHELQTFVEDPPLLVVEILSPSTAATDRRAKMALYARFGIPEYWIVDPDRSRLNAYSLIDRAYVSIEEDVPGQMRSRVFQGLVLAVDSLFGGLQGWLDEGHVFRDGDTVGRFIPLTSRIQRSRGDR